MDKGEGGREATGGLYDCKLLAILQTTYRRRQEYVMARGRGVCEKGVWQGRYEDFVTAKFWQFCRSIIKGDKRTL